jgi:RecA/RadA recombinase
VLDNKWRLKMAKKSLSAFNVDDFVDEALKAAEATFGQEKCYVAAGHEKTMTVLPVTPLSVRWLIESNGWPLGRITQSGGGYGTQKSSFAFQLIQWYLEAGGFVVLIDTENKTSSSLLRSMIAPEFFDTNDPKHKRFMIVNATTIEEWQRIIQEQCKRLMELSEVLKRKPSFPILFVVDSLMGSSSEEGLEQIKTEGAAPGRTYSDAALVISQYMKVFPNTLLNWPITVHTIHHEKPNIGLPGMSRQGGKAPDFYATLDFQFKRGGVTSMGKSMEYSNLKLQAKNISLSVRKSSMGSDVDKELSVAFCWSFDGTKQRSWWDWDSASAMLLAKYANQLTDIMDINHETRQRVGEVFWSEKLGIAEENAVPASEFGKLVDSNIELKTKLEEALHVQCHPEVGAKPAESAE